jgi:2-oxoglutarate dehydrogenase E1 component
VRIRSAFDTYNAAYVQAVFEQYLQNPASVDEAWRTFFAGDRAGTGGLLGAPANGAAAPAVAVTETQLLIARAAGELVDAYRLHGHRAAHLDPLGSPPAGHPQLDPVFHGITREALDDVPASMVGLGRAGETIGDRIDWLRETYTGTIGYEFEYLEDPESREWLRRRIEAGEHRAPLSADERVRLLARLTDVEGFEQFIHRAYLGAKRFSIEGTDMLVPMLDLAFARAAAQGAHTVVLGMAHRGRLNVLAHLVRVEYDGLIEKFEGRHALMAGTGDVKYHLGAEGSAETADGTLTVLLAPNPSHLEFVDPVVVGISRARQSQRDGRTLTRNEDAVVPILIHGDAAFSAQGVVAETLNLARLDGFRTGGTLHIIANNQVGFTTDPRDARSTDYASDMARGFDLPIFHVNADDPEACLAVVRLALAYRARFHGDVVIDLVGYRRYGHNEGDEPAYTQPVMYDRITKHPTVRALWADRLVQSGALSAEDVEALQSDVHERMMAAQDRIRAAGHDYTHHPPEPDVPASIAVVVDTAVTGDRLRAYDRQLHAWPRDFTPHPKLARQLEKRSQVLDEGGSLDWAHAEALAFASLLADGVPVRMTGQDSERGTFSQRHLVLHDARTGRIHTPLAHLTEARAPFEIHNSPLSELGVVGFEYGYSVVAPETLVLWEAQFGDFSNGAQVIIDQFLAAGRAKWAQESRLVLLLPHGYEGQGPEHSNARLERFLQLCGENNMRVANCSTPAQYFHLLRRQSLLSEARPLVVMTPKSLLRHPKAVSTLDTLAQGRFQRIIDDASADPSQVTRIVLCSGKVFYDLSAAREKKAAPHVALMRVEQLYPLRIEELAPLVSAYEGAREVAWVQEEPANMGAWRYIEPFLARLAADRPVRYIGRPERASPAEGYANDHEAEQNRIVADALAPLEPAPARRSKRAGRRTRT